MVNDPHADYANLPCSASVVIVVLCFAITAIWNFNINLLLLQYQWQLHVRDRLKSYAWLLGGRTLFFCQASQFSNGSQTAGWEQLEKLFFSKVQSECESMWNSQHWDNKSWINFFAWDIRALLKLKIYLFHFAWLLARSAHRRRTEKIGKEISTPCSSCWSDKNKLLCVIFLCSLKDLGCRFSINLGRSFDWRVTDYD